MTDELPHTGMQVPHRRLKLAAPGLLSWDGVIAAQICIDLDTGEEIIEALRWPAGITADSFFDYAALCRDPAGNALDVEDVLAMLRAEYATDRALIRAAHAGETVCQPMLPLGDGYIPGDAMRVAPWETRDQIAWRAEHMGCPTGTWWRLYDGKQWEEVELVSATAA